jgi:hypothetical protein
MKKEQVAKKMKGKNPHVSHEVEAAKNRINQNYFNRRFEKNKKGEVAEY